MSSILQKTIKDGSRILRDILSSEDFSRLNGFLQSIDPRLKFLSIAIMIAATASCSKWTFSSVLILLSTILAIASKIPGSFFIKRTFVFIPMFAGMLVLPIPFITEGSPIIKFSLGFATLTMTKEGTIIALSFFLRVWACVSLILLMILTTSNSALMTTLRSLHFPKILVTTLIMGFRYTITFLDMVHRKVMGAESRMLKFSVTDIRKALAYGVANFMIEAYERGERVYHAMLSRGYEGEMKFKPRKTELHFRDYVFGAISVIIASSAILANLLT